MDNFVKIIDSLAWPIAVLILAFAFRAELRKILNRMSRLKYKELEATFDNELSQVENSRKSHAEPEQEPLPEKPEEKSAYAQLLRIAEVSPRAAVTESWREVEAVVDQLATSMGIDAKSPLSGIKVIRSLIQEERVDASLLEEYTRLRKLRNQAAHAGEFDISQTEAERYAALAVEIAGFLKRFVKES